MTKRGFSLIELLVGLGLILFLVLATAELILFSTRAKGEAEAAQAAFGLVAEKLEELRSLRPEDPGLEPGARAEAVTPPGEERLFLRTWTVEPLPAGLRRVEVEVTAEAGGRGAAMVLYLSSEAGW